MRLRPRAIEDGVQVDGLRQKPTPPRILRPRAVATGVMRGDGNREGSRRGGSAGGHGRALAGSPAGKLHFSVAPGGRGKIAVGAGRSADLAEGQVVDVGVG